MGLKPFEGLVAFPLTPADERGAVDVDLLGRSVRRLVDAGVDSIGILGSTGIYAYLEPVERGRAVAAAVEAAGPTPVVVGVGALRTSWAVRLARDAERAGASGLLLAPMSYVPLVASEVSEHFRAVAGATALPLCIYDNPTTTSFAFGLPLISELSGVPGIAAIKMPLPADMDFAGEIAAIAAATPPGFAAGYSGDWGAGASLLAGGRAWYSVVAGLLPAEALRLARAAQAGRADEVRALDDAFEPLWRLFRVYGSLRVMYEVAECLSLPMGAPPAPLRRVGAGVARQVASAVGRLADGLASMPSRPELGGRA